MKRLFSVLTVLLLLVYLGFQVTRNLTQQIETVDALVVEALDKTTCEGIFVRDVIPVYGEEHKTYEFLAENGEKISMGGSLAVCFDDPAGAEAFRQARVLDQDIASAREAEGAIKSDAGLTLDTDIFADMEDLSAMLSQGSAWQSDGLYAGLTQNVIARDYPRERLDELGVYIDQLESQRSSLDKAAAGGRHVRAEKSGYFIKASESSPSPCTVEEMYGLTPDSLKTCIEQGREAERESGVIGYLMETFEWYFVCEMPAEDAQAVAERAAQTKRNTIDLSFPYILADSIEAKVDKVTYFDDKAVVIFRCGFIDEGFLCGAVETCDVVKRSYTGIKVPREAIHLKDEAWGVYCLSGAMLKFKPVEWLYKGGSYYIAEPADSASKGLYLYDKIVVRGKGLEVNKVIK